MSSPIQSSLQALQTLAAQAAGGAKAASVQTSVGAGGFADELAASIDRINRLQQQAGAKGLAFQSGAPGVELDDLMVDMQKASLAFQMGVQVRNRLVSAYRDIMNMQV
ncbi:flagellar hook-basal body complex protein FliE [Thauera aromatica]|nr:flagellar hook-basal body complex protein FliE [Thauera aromatica]MCK2127335.1 flagellar hook-basal body complex protein FliE [Thauera aromatica]